MRDWSSDVCSSDLDRPGARVLLVLTSCKVVHWQVKATEGTTLAGILVSGYETPIVSADVHVPE